MRISVTSLDEFFECLDAEQKVFQDTIRVGVGRRATDPTSKTPARFDVILQSAALVEVTTPTEYSEYLLQIGLLCGKDYEDSQPQRDGSEIAAMNKRRIVEYAAKRGWRVLPGLIEE